MVFDPSIIPDSQKIRLACDSSAIGANQIDFPLVIQLDGTNPLHAALFADLGSNNKKLSIEYGGNQCQVEIENWDATGNLAALHAKIPIYAHATDPELILSYDSSQADNDTYVGVSGSTPAQGVWSSNDKGLFVTWRKIQAVALY